MMPDNGRSEFVASLGRGKRQMPFQARDKVTSVETVSSTRCVDHLIGKGQGGLNGYSIGVDEGPLRTDLQHYFNWAQRRYPVNYRLR